MDFPGKVIQFIGETSGVSKAGKPWKKKEWVVETFNQYPKKVKLQCFGDRSDQMNLEPGRDYTFHVDLESREFQGRWYTDVSVYRVEEYTAQPMQPIAPQGGYPSQGGFGGSQYGGNNMNPFGNPPYEGESSVGESDEDLPF